MTRKETEPYISELKMYANSKGWDEEYLIACDIAIDTMRKYQKIEEIMHKVYISDNIDECLVQRLAEIRDVMENTISTKEREVGE